MIVRRLDAADADAFQAVRLRGLRESPEAFGSSYEEEAGRPLDAVAERLAGAAGSAVFGAFGEDGVLLGVGGLHRQTQRKARHRAGIWGMCVVPEARGRGVGRAVLGALVDHARTLEDVHRLELGVATTNAAARALYLAAGFTSCGVQPDAYRADGRSYDSELMTLALEDGLDSPQQAGRIRVHRTVPREPCSDRRVVHAARGSRAPRLLSARSVRAAP